MSKYNSKCSLNCNKKGCGTHLCQRYADYQQGVREFAEWLPQHFDLRFSNNPDVWIDEFFNHTSDKILAEWKKGNQ